MTDFDEEMKEWITKGVEKAIEKAKEAVRQSLAEWAIERQTKAAKQTKKVMGLELSHVPNEDMGEVNDKGEESTQETYSDVSKLLTEVSPFQVFEEKPERVFVQTAPLSISKGTNLLICSPNLYGNALITQCHRVVVYKFHENEYGKLSGMNEYGNESRKILVSSSHSPHSCSIFDSSYIRLFSSLCLLTLFPLTIISEEVDIQQQCGRDAHKCGFLDVPFPFFVNGPASSPPACSLPDAFRLSFLELNKLKLVSKNDPGSEREEFLIEVMVPYLKKKKQSQKEAINALPLYPNEHIIWDESLVPSINYSGEGCLALPKLNLQFLTLHDYLLRNFNLFRLAYVNNEGETAFRGWSRMGVPIKEFKIKSVKQPNIGEVKPSSVTAEVTFRISSYKAQVRSEWNSLKEHDVLFLFSIRTLFEPLSVEEAESATVPQKLGLQYVHGCEVIEMRDEEGTLMNDFTGRIKRDEWKPPKGELRIVTVALDMAQYHMDVTDIAEKSGDDVYGTFNVSMRRKPKENNFKAILESTRDLMNETCIVPDWLHDIFLGYGNPSAAQWTNMPDLLDTVDFKDTFLDADHVLQCFSGYQVSFLNTDGTENSSPRPPFRIKLPRNLKGNIHALPGPYPQDQPKQNSVRFTPTQIGAIISGIQPGLTMVVGPPGTGKTHTDVQILKRDVPARYLLRLGQGEQECTDKTDTLKTDKMKVTKFWLGKELVEDSTLHVHWKGAAEYILAMCSSYYDSSGNVHALDDSKREKLGRLVEGMAASSFRCIAFAHMQVSQYECDDGNVKLKEDNLVLIGLIGIKNPGRAGMRKAVQDCQLVGINVKMITRDNVSTAKVIVTAWGILKINQDRDSNEEYSGVVVEGLEFWNYAVEERMDRIEIISVMARSSPFDKLLMVQTLKQKEHIVAVTSDVANDAPALNEANIGLSMGIAGTKVAKESSDIVIVDDSFATVVDFDEEADVARKVLNTVNYTGAFIESSILLEAFQLWVPFPAFDLEDKVVLWERGNVMDCPQVNWAIKS